jgi:hypothetical protein
MTAVAHAAATAAADTAADTAAAAAATTAAATFAAAAAAAAAAGNAPACAEAPPVSWLEAWEVVLRRRGAQVVALQASVLKELCIDLATQEETHVLASTPCERDYRLAFMLQAS